MKIEDLIVETKKDLIQYQMKIIENKCTGATLIEWQKLKDLQPQNLKVPYHTEKIKKSIIELGFANPFDVWVNPETNEMLIADGHGRKDVLLELIADGFQVPNELPCTFLDNTKIKTEKEAIQYLLRVFNIKTNAIDVIPLENWLEDVDLHFQEVAFDDLNIKMEDADFQNTEIEAEEVKPVESNKDGGVKDLLGNLKSKRCLEIECSSEAEQEILYNRFLQEGLKVKIINL